MQNKKKLLFISFIAALMSVLFVFMASANAIGDVDGDGSITAGDARYALRAAVKLENYAAGSAKFLACDVDFDNTITASDARLILRAAVKLDTLKERNSGSTAHVHNWSDWTPEKNDKNIVTGYHTRTCSAANCPVPDGTERAACTYGSKIYTTAQTAPTCTKSATYYRECSVCKGKSVATDAALEHKNKRLDASRSKEPTCTESGWYVYYCPDCGKYGDQANLTAKETAALYEEFDALGHTVEAGSISGDSDVICSRCGLTLTPSFNTLVNSLKSSDLYFSTLTKNESGGTLSKFALDIPLAVRLLMSAEGYSADQIKEEFTASLAQDDISYAEYYLRQPIATSDFFPIAGKDYVSALTGSDIADINIVENMSSLDFISEIPDSARVSLNANYTYNVDLSPFKSLAPVDKNITKITVTVKTEKYSSIKNTSSETSLMRITGNDIRTLFDSFNESENEDGFNLEMTCKEITSNCAVSYYFDVTEENGGKSYTPIAARYCTTVSVDQHVDLALSVEGLGDLMNGDIDMTINNVGTVYYFFTTE